MNPAAVALKAILEALKEGEFYDERNRETCYLVTAGSVALAKAKAVALFDLDLPLIESVEPTPDQQIDITDLFKMLD